ncbi:tRNA (adenosine(37)-N6)-threonylcarbamoyltransferase complex ATPase subunit type 1 TsaE [Lachnospiraceae bacterium oral taxon 500]|nr:tRNA (adenosine(37)-N6)-threonylcarbamoyltransferase complex ATPase subunit type 1 TsaE [Lachnospiraceae bacterium oral taxon 500]
MQIIETKTSKETRDLGRRLAESAPKGAVFALAGDLGVGKTVFSQGFAEGLGIEEPVSSPTFTLVNEYHQGRLPFFHFDVYRLEEPEELEAIGFEEYVYGQGVTLIEWADRFPELLPAQTVWIRIEKDYAQGEDYRRITIDQTVPDRA